MAICLGIYPIFRQTHIWIHELGPKEPYDRRVYEGYIPQMPDQDANETRNGICRVYASHSWMFTQHALAWRDLKSEISPIISLSCLVEVTLFRPSNRWPWTVPSSSVDAHWPCATTLQSKMGCAIKHRKSQGKHIFEAKTGSSMDFLEEMMTTGSSSKTGSSINQLRRNSVGFKP